MQVVFKSTGQMLSAPVQVLYEYADALRVKQKPLPQVGTWGLVVFPYGDIRNGLWLGAYLPSAMDALTGTQASGQAATDPFIDYEAHFSGDWRLLDGLGNLSKQFADGSFIIGASGTTLPTVYRHTVDANNAQETLAYTRGDRIPAPPSPFNFIFQHATGTKLEVNSSGAVSVSGISTLSIQFGGTTLTISAAGLVTLALTGSETLNITQGGGSASDFLALVSKLVSAFNGHTHSGVQSGGSPTGTPTSPISASTISSTAINISN